MVNFSNMTNVLNYVTGGTDRTEIYGTLHAPGVNVFIVNPKGGLIGEGAQITAQSFMASSRTMMEDDLNNFNGVLPDRAISAGGEVLNLGTIEAVSVRLEGNKVVLQTQGSDGSSAPNTASASAVYDSSAREISEAVQFAKQLKEGDWLRIGRRKRYDYTVNRRNVEIKGINTSIAGKGDRTLCSLT